MNLKKLRVEYRNSLKSSDTEETIDLCFYRPIGYVWALLARKCGIHPNTITIASIFLGVGAGVMFYFNTLWMNIIGMFLLIWANSFDSADGQLARLTGQYSRVGRILDGLSGDLWFLTIYIAICLREPRSSVFFHEHTWTIWVLAVIAGISHTKQAGIADYYRQFHLYFLKGERGSELESSYNLKRQLALIPKRDIFRRLSMIFYLIYTKQQELTTPSMQRFRLLLKQKYPEGHYPEKIRTSFLAGSRPLMKYTNFLTFNWRAIILFAALFAGMPWLYLAIEVTLFNIVMIYMIVRHEKLCSRLSSVISSNQ